MGTPGGGIVTGRLQSLQRPWPAGAKRGCEANTRRSPATGEVTGSDFGAGMAARAWSCGFAVQRRDSKLMSRGCGGGVTEIVDERDACLVTGKLAIAIGGRKHLLEQTAKTGITKPAECPDG